MEKKKEENDLFLLNWEGHRGALCRSLDAFRAEEKYTDVTLSCDDHVYHVHKVVLAMCSEYFQKIFESTAGKHSLVVAMIDVERDILELLLTYMYRGELCVPRDALDRLLRVAGRLKVKGLAVPTEAGDDLSGGRQKPSKRLREEECQPPEEERVDRRKVIRGEESDRSIGHQRLSQLENNDVTVSSPSEGTMQPPGDREMPWEARPVARIDDVAEVDASIIQKEQVEDSMQSGEDGFHGSGSTREDRDPSAAEPQTVSQPDRFEMEQFMAKGEPTNEEDYLEIKDEVVEDKDSLAALPGLGRIPSVFVNEAPDNGVIEAEEETARAEEGSSERMRIEQPLPTLGKQQAGPSLWEWYIMKALTTGSAIPDDVQAEEDNLSRAQDEESDYHLHHHHHHHHSLFGEEEDPTAKLWNDLQDYRLPVFSLRLENILLTKISPQDYMPATANRRMVIDTLTSDLVKRQVLTPSRKGYTNLLSALFNKFPYLGDQKCWRMSLRTKMKSIRGSLKSETLQVLKDKFGCPGTGGRKRPMTDAPELEEGGVGGGGGGGIVYENPQVQLMLQPPTTSCDVPTSVMQ